MDSPEKRVSKRTARVAVWDADRLKSRTNIETRARNRNVRAEEAQLTAWEEEEEDQAAEHVEESPVKKAPKGKNVAKQVVAPRSSSPADGTDEEEARNIAQVRADEARFLELKFMIHGRDQVPIDELELLDLPDLEKRWKAGPSKPSASPTKGKGKQSDALPKKTSSAPPKKTTNKTPAKTRVTKRSVSKVTALDSPLVPFNQAKEQLMHAESTPVPAKRTRDTSTDRNPAAQRPRLDLTEKPKISRMSAPVVKAPAFDNPAASTTTSRASSRVPSAAPSRSQSTAPSNPVPRGGYADFNGEDIDLDIGHDGADTDTGNQARITEPVKRTSKQPKPRAKKGDITDPLEKAVVNRAVEETVALLVLDMCANTDETEVKIGKAWAKAVKCLELPAEEWQMTTHNLAVCKSLIGGFRSRGRQRTTQIILSHFDLGLSPDQDAEEVKKLANDLLPIEFLRDIDPDDPDNDDAGYYQSSIIARVIAAIWFTGAKPVTSRYPALLNPIPVDVIAYVSALMQDILKRLAKDGYIKVEKRATTEEEKRKKEQEKARLKAIAKAKGVKPEASETRAAVNPVRALMATHYNNLATFEEVVGANDFKLYQINLFKNAFKWAGKQTTDSDDEGETETRPEPGVLTAASFAGDLRKARSQKATSLVSGSGAQSSSKSSSKRKAQPQPSSRLSDDDHQPDAGPKARRLPGHPAKDRGQDTSALSDEQVEESTGEASMGAPAKRRVPAQGSGKGHQEETDGEIEE
ncbi:hypothetical protein FRC07_014825, partial [Ceratobasidium sp. 392]